MPLVRFGVRNEYGLGQPELYREADKEDPKAVLDGVAVAGLVGILRQLGDLAEFAAEVFHGLQEQVMTTASRSHKLMVRVQNIEASLPPLEKAVLAQTSHIHFAYTAGSEWHPRIPLEQNHFVYNDLPRFIMDSYEECRDPPRLYMLDKFDAGGPGSCLKRYSDPTFFKRVSGSSNEATTEKIQSDKKARKSKKKKSSQRNREISRVASLSSHSGRMNFSRPDVSGRTSSQTASTVDMALQSEIGYHSNSFDSRTGSGYIECLFNVDPSFQPGEQESKEPSSRLRQPNDALDSGFCDERAQMVDNSIPQSSPEEQIARSSSCVSWHEKTEIVEPDGQQCDRAEAPVVHLDNDIDAQVRTATNYISVDQMDILLEDRQCDRSEAPDVLLDNFDIDAQDRKAANYRNVDQMDILLADEDTPKSLSNRNQLDEIESETDNYMDALNTIESESENDLDCQTKREVEKYSSTVGNGRNKDGIHEHMAHSSDHYPFNSDCHTESNISPCNGMPSSPPNSIFSKTIVHEQTPQIHEISADLYPHSSRDGMPSGVPNSASKSIAYEETPEFPEITSDLDPHMLNNGMPFGLLNLVPSKSIIHEQTPQNSEKLSDFDPHSSSKGMPSGLPYSASKSIAHEQTPQLPERSSDPDNSLGIDYHASGDIRNSCKVESVVTDVSRIESVGSDLSFSGGRISQLQDQSGNKTSESQQSDAEISGGPPVSFWTNGGLLGLQPSKPPDFAVSNAASQNYLSRTDNETGGPPKHALKGDGQKEKVDKLVQSDDAKFEHSGGPYNTNSFGSSNITNLSAPGADRDPDVKADSTEVNQKNDGNSSLVFGLGHRLLFNGFHRKSSIANDDKYESVSSLGTGVSNRGGGHNCDGYQSTSEMTLVEKFGYGSPLISLTSSPPLEQMKISFNPVDGFDTSKLKLKFPDGILSHESVRDMFASFQLVPEPSMPLHDCGSESDDDTFCRSSPYMSDDFLSQHSDSNSEQWESGDSTAGSKDQELYDVLCRVSSMQPVSSCLQAEGTVKNGMHIDHGFEGVYTDSDAELCPSVLDLPSFDTMNPLLERQTKTNSDAKHLLKQHHKESGPLPPPLPPMQWRVSKSHSGVAKEKQYPVSEDSKGAVDLKLELALARQQLTHREVIPSEQENKEDQQNLNGQKEENGKVMDEKEDFLHQIRTKSFSLRPTALAKPTSITGPSPTTFTSGPPAKVTAILQKANAIRQAVGSDDGDDDDTWSDT